MNIIPESVRTHTGHNANAEALKSNCWAPDVIWNEAMGKWCMYLSVNGDMQRSVIVLLISDDLDGTWSYMGEVVYSRMDASPAATADYKKVTGEESVPGKYSAYRNSEKNLIYGVNAIDAAVTYDENGDLWMSYGSWFGGIYMLKLDEATGLRDYTYQYKNVVKTAIGGEDFTGEIANGQTFVVYSDAYLGLHIAGGAHANAGGEGSYFLKIGKWWYLFLSYGGLAPKEGYNMRVFRSATLTGFDANGDFVGYKDAKDNYAVFSTGDAGIKVNGEVGNRIMSGYTWSWWDYSYIAQGHNSAFVDGDKAYLVYHNKYTDGTIIHVLKVHELLVNADGWLVTSPFESTVQTTDVSSADELATGLSTADIAGKYGAVNMTNNNGTYDAVATEAVITLAENNTVSGAISDTWTYDDATGAFTLTTGGVTYDGFLLWQNLEGTNIRTLVFSAVSKAGQAPTQYTYWGYKYPTAKQQAEYLINSYAIPDRATTDAVIPSGALSNGLWDDVKVTFSLESSTGTLTATYEGGSIAIGIGLATEGTIEVDEVTAGKTFTPVNTDNGVSISFDYSNYTSDLTPVISGEGFSLALGVMQNFEGDESHLYEWQAASQGAFTQFADKIYDAFLVPNGTARATISFNEDGSISYYRDGVWIFTQTADTLFKRGVNDAQQDVAGQTVAVFNQKILAAFAAGTVKCDYNISNVVIGEQASANNVYDETNFLTPTDTTISVIGEIKGAASGEVLPAIADATTDGVAVSFSITGYTDIWTKVISNGAGFSLGWGALDPFVANSTGIHNCNYGPGDDVAAQFKDGGVHFATIAVSADGNIRFYKDGNLIWTAPSTQNMYNFATGTLDGPTVKEFADGFLNEAASNGLILGSVNLSDLIVTDALTDEQAESIYQDYLNLSPYDSEKFIDVEGVEEIGEIKGAASGEVLPAIADATTDGVAVSFSITGYTDIWAKVISNGAGFSLGWGALDPFVANSTGIHNCNYGPGDDVAAQFKDGGAHFATIAVSADGSIRFYKDGNLIWTAPSTQNMYNFATGALDGPTVKEFADGFLNEAASNGLILGSVNLSDLIVTNALTDEQAKDVFDAYNAYLCLCDGHQYVESSVTGSACTGFEKTYTCSRCGDSYTATDLTGVVGHKYTVSATEATCTEPAKLTYTCSVCDYKFTADIDALGHDYGEPEWTWGSYTSATATFTCTRSGCDHTVAVTAVIESEVTTPATCKGTGVRTYTATATFGEQKYKDTNTETIAALGHNYEGVQPTWAWDGYTSAKATFQCTRCDHTETETAVITSEVTTPATCKDTGVRKYTATVTFGEQKYKDTNTETIAALGHNYENVQPTWAWEGYASATATFKCTRCDHTETETAVITSKVTTPATCDGTGVREYTATVTFGKEQYTDTETETVAALGHEWGTPVYAGTTLSASCTRADCPAGRSATVAFAAGDGKGEITALTATFDGTVFTVTLPNDGMTANEEGYLLTGWTVGEESYATNVQVEIAPGANGTFTAVYTMHEHSYTAVAEVPATCEKEGVKAHFTCTCGRLFVSAGEGYTEVQPADLAISALGHDYENVQPTWAWDGYTSATATFTCTRCTHKKEVTAAITNEVTTPATCEGTGVRTYTATVTFGGKPYTDDKTEPVAALGHSWDEGSVTKPATCTEKGVKTFACTRDGCDKTRTEEIPQAEHTPEAVPGKDATCTEAGLTEGSKCSVCGAVLKEQEEIPAKGHSWGDWTETTPATCTEKGTETRTCTACDAAETRDIEALGHDYTDVQPTWAWDGYTSATATFKCTRCDHTETVTATGTQITNAVTTAATCEGTGVRTYTATAPFGKEQYTDTKTEEIPTAAHTPEAVPGKEATCTEAGLTEGSKCSVCGEVLKEQEEIPAKGHSWGEWTQTKPATCTEKGVKTFACTRDGCDKTRTEEIPAAGHTYSEEWLHDADGHWHKCESCDAVTQTEAHAWGDWTTTKEATATENGSRSRECSVCGEEQSEVIPATGTQPAPDDDPDPAPDGDPDDDPDDDPDPAPDDDPDGSVSDEGLSDGAIAGIVIGCTVGALAIAYVVLAILFKKGIVKGAFFSRIFPFIK